MEKYPDHSHNSANAWQSLSDVEFAGKNPENRDQSPGDSPQTGSQTDSQISPQRRTPERPKDQGRELLENPKYLEKVYGPQIEKTDWGMERSIERIQEVTADAINNEQISVQELLDDPFLRERHINKLYRKDHLPVERVLWAVDGKNFYNSPQYKQFLQEKRDANAEIFTSVDKGEIDRETQSALEQIPDRDLKDIISVYEKDKKQGDRLLIATLLPIMGLTKNPPKLAYIKSMTGENASYHIPTHTISVTDVLSEPVSDEKPKFRLFRSKKLESTDFKRMNVLAHELWHAHQYQGDNVPDERRAAYRQNRSLYVDVTLGYEAYREQLVEREASTFGDKFEVRAKKLYHFPDELPYREYAKREKSK